MFQVSKINNVKVNAIPLEKIDPNKIKGYDLFAEPYANIYMVAHKKSGKTTCIFKILKECTNKDTKLVFFGATLYNDPAWKYVMSYFKKKGNPILKYTAIMEEGVDHLKMLLESLQEEGKVQMEEDEEDEKPIPPTCISCDDDEEKEKPKRKPKKLAPNIIFVFDDLSKGMRIPSFSLLIKTNRHYKSKVIISSQNLKDIQPDARENINYLLLFKGIKEELLKTIHEDFNIKLDLRLFIELYKQVTAPKYSFLYIDVEDQNYRQNFDIAVLPSQV